MAIYPLKYRIIYSISDLYLLYVVYSMILSTVFTDQLTLNLKLIIISICRRYEIVLVKLGELYL